MGGQASKNKNSIPEQQLSEQQRRQRERKREREAFVAARIHLLEVAEIASEIRRNQDKVIANKRQLQQEAFLAEQKKLQEEADRLAEHKRLQKEALATARKKLQEEAANLAAQKRKQEETLLASQRKLQEEAAKIAIQKKLQEEAFIAAQKKLQEDADKLAQQKEAARSAQQEEEARKARQEETARRARIEEAVKEAQQEVVARIAALEADRIARLEKVDKEAQQVEAARVANLKQALKEPQHEKSTIRPRLEEATKKKQQEDDTKRAQREETAESAFVKSLIVKNSNLTRNAFDLPYCATCPTRFASSVYRCGNGHNFCNRCRFLDRKSCTPCGSYLTDQINYGFDKHVSQTKVPCPHKSKGCVLFIKMEEMEIHLKECPFKIQDCPLSEHLNCQWTGETSELRSHFSEMHPEHLAVVGSELHLRNIHKECRNLTLFEFGYYFIYHLKISQKDNKIYMAVQLIGTKISAKNIVYEIQVYNKSEESRTYVYTDNCRASLDDMKEVFESGDCAVLPITYARTFLNNGEVSFRLFIKRTKERW